MSSEPMLSLRDVRVSFVTADGVVQAVRGVDLDVAEGEVVAVVGESGSGKSATMLAVLGLHPPGRSIVGGEILWCGESLVEVSQRRLRAVRGAEIAMVFQDPLTSLNPVLSVGRQIIETIRAHEEVGRAAARRRAIEALGQVGIPRPEQRIDDHPHQFSGGMRQRVMIAMALSCGPRLLIADEPTTALDVTVQAQVLDLLIASTAQVGAGLVLITHDLGVVAGVADRLAVMYAGRIVESGSCDGTFAEPTHPYTVALLDSIPRVDSDRGDDRLRPIRGRPPSMLRPPPGCAFHPRCPIAEASAGCDTLMPELVGHAHSVACWRRATGPVQQERTS